MPEQLSNFARSTLVNAVDSDDLTLTLADASNFPATGNFVVRIDNELMRCSARSGNVITVSSRGAESTTAVNHSSGSTVTQPLTKQSLANYVSQNGGGGGGGTVDWTDVENKPDFATVATSGSYNDLTDQPTIPTLPIDAADTTGFATVATSGSYNDLTDQPTIPTLPIDAADTTGFATVATSGSYNDLTDQPTIPTLPIDAADTTGFATVATTGSYNDLTDKPTIPTLPIDAADTTGFATVATSGSYNDLSDQPTIPDLPDGPTSPGLYLLLDDDIGPDEWKLASEVGLSEFNDDLGLPTLPIDAADTTGFATVATTGSYNDLTDVPTPDPNDLAPFETLGGYWTANYHASNNGNTNGVVDLFSGSGSYGVNNLSFCRYDDDSNDWAGKIGSVISSTVSFIKIIHKGSQRWNLYKVGDMNASYTGTSWDFGVTMITGNYNTKTMGDELTVIFIPRVANGNPFDQELNMADSPTFDTATLTQLLTNDITAAAYGDVVFTNSGNGFVFTDGAGGKDITFNPQGGIECAGLAVYTDDLTPTELFRVDTNGTIALATNTGTAGQVLTSNGTAAASWEGLDTLIGQYVGPTDTVTFNSVTATTLTVGGQTFISYPTTDGDYKLTVTSGVPSWEPI